ncbi:MAG: DUF4442 domain-containing protein [Bacteriovoracaceae bacterium]|jgi:acyl-coenzyme A thioesterase PaaI-like protein|nr:DUF4442 domain-containing protein [Bacteriovoracaceae bacterium]
MPRPNKLKTSIDKINTLPAGSSLLITKALGMMIKFAGTAGIEFLNLSEKKVVVRLKNKRKVQNHLGQVHAAAMALTVETATGFVVGMNLPDDKIPLLKSMHIDYVKRSTGDLVATATLSDEQIEQIKTLDKGEVCVNVEMMDEEGIEPTSAQLTWAWIPKKR